MTTSTPACERDAPRIGPVAVSTALLLLTYLGFVSLGLPDAAYGVAWPSLRESFVLGQGMFGLGLLSVGIGFLFSSLSAGTLLRRFGAGRLLAGSTVLTASGLVGFALAPGWEFFLMAGILVGIGGGAIDSGLNAYAASHYSARQMNWLHAAFGFGAALGPLAMAFAVAQSDWRTGYALIAAAMGLLALLFLVTRRLWEGGSVAGSAEAFQAVSATRAARNRLVQLQTATFFLYAGVEVSAGQWAFAVLTQARGHTIEAGGVWTGAFWFALFAGRVLLGFGADRIGATRLVRYGVLAALGALLLFALDPLGAGVVGLIVAGFALAPVFPMLMHRTPMVLSPGLAAHSIGFQVSAAMAGAVAMPALLGLLAARFGVESVPLFLAGGAALLVVLALRALSAGQPVDATVS